MKKSRQRLNRENTLPSIIAPYWNWRIEVNKTHNSLGKTELYYIHSLRPYSITVTICPLQFSPFIHAISRSNSATQHISPISFIQLGKYNSGVWEPSNQTVSYDEMALWQQYSLKCSRELWLDITIQCEFTSEC